MNISHENIMCINLIQWRRPNDDSAFFSTRTVTMLFPSRANMCRNVKMTIALEKKEGEKKTN